MNTTTRVNGKTYTLDPKLVALADSHGCDFEYAQCNMIGLGFPGNHHPDYLLIDRATGTFVSWDRREGSCGWGYFGSNDPDNARRTYSKGFTGYKIGIFITDRDPHDGVNEFTRKKTLKENLLQVIPQVKKDHGPDIIARRKEQWDRDAAEAQDSKEAWERAKRRFGSGPKQS